MQMKLIFSEIYDTGAFGVEISVSGGQDTFFTKKGLTL